MCTQNGNAVESYVLGQKFEWYVREFLFVDSYYDLLEVAPPFTKNKRHFSLSALRPDFKFQDQRTGIRFYVEAKFRSGQKNNSDVRCSYYDQLNRYRSFNKECPTFLILGLGGSPTQPALVTLLPIEETYPNLFMRQIRKFQIEANRAISTDVLWSARR
jgi:hypothetical protein